ncbi:hypothetical protein [Flavobacterium sp. 1]|nr:hypothetical protein [Flavobacterium sp. 1]
MIVGRINERDSETPDGVCFCFMLMWAIRQLAIEIKSPFDNL